ncbi:MAG: DUF134 domain-containing protein [Sporomusaceae bacterium]|nr:DUF134 domain-containing protein [Sporomusaceae bacterium]
MARPRKWRNVCCLPKNSKFGPLDQPSCCGHTIAMTVDEYETIRLIDLENLTQQECAGRMNIARTTVQSMYNEARRKIAESLVNGKILMIDGGEYQLCNGQSHCCSGRCHRNSTADLPIENDKE